MMLDCDLKFVNKEITPLVPNLFSQGSSDLEVTSSYIHSSVTSIVAIVNPRINVLAELKISEAKSSAIQNNFITLPLESVAMIVCYFSSTYQSSNSRE